MLEEERDDPKYDAIMRNLLARRLTGMIPTYFITISLFHPQCGLSPEKAYDRFSGDLKALHKEIINRLDRAIYGSRHHKKKFDGLRFRYFYRLETVSKMGYAVFPHIHILVEWDGWDMNCFKTKSAKLHSGLKRVCQLKGFRPDIDIQAHDGNKRDYIAKYPLVDILNTHDRGLCERTRRTARPSEAPIPRNL